MKMDNSSIKSTMNNSSLDTFMDKNYWKEQREYFKEKTKAFKELKQRREIEIMKNELKHNEKRNKNNE